MKRLLTLAVLFLLLIGTMPVAHAQESIPEVSTLSELQDAIAQAEEGDTIKIMQTITINFPVTLGMDGKPVTLCGADGLETLLRFEGDWGYASYCWLYDLTIDGTGSLDGSKVVVATPNSVYTTRVNWQNCSTNGFGAAMRIDRGTVYTMEGSFSNCSADLGGAIYADINTSLYPSGCTFSNCYSRRDGGAIYTMGTATIDNCTFINNSAVNGNGGAAAGINLSVRNSTITGNRALYGGGLYLMGGTVQNSKVYANIGDFAGADLYGDGTVSIVVDDYLSLFGEILSENGNDSVAWYSDYEESRYSAEAPTEITEDTQTLNNPALVFVMYQKEVPVEPEPEPEPEPTPTPIPDPEPSHSSSHRPQKVEPKPVEPKYPTLACGKAKLEGENVVYLIDALKRFTPAQERLTRGRAAALLYGLMSADSQAECDKIAVDCYDDLYGSPYQKVVSALAGAGVFCGQSDSSFLPDSIMTYGQLLTVLTRFVEPKEGYIGSFNVLDHWAAPAAVTAASYGWIEDVPIDLNAPATYGAFVNLLIKIYDL